MNEIKIVGTSRVADNDNALLLSLDHKPSDEDIRFLHKSQELIQSLRARCEKLEEMVRAAQPTELISLHIDGKDIKTEGNYLLLTIDDGVITNMGLPSAHHTMNEPLYVINLDAVKALAKLENDNE